MGSYTDRRLKLVGAMAELGLEPRALVDRVVEEGEWVWVVTTGACARACNTKKSFIKLRY